MRVIGLCLCVAYALPGSAVAQSVGRTDEEVVAQAEAAFRMGVEGKNHVLQARKHFFEATNAYRELHRRGIRSVALYRSLGNAAMLADRWPEAIWAFQIGLKLDPNDQIMREHLAFARAKVLYPPGAQGRPEGDPWPDWLRRPPIDGLVYMVLASFVLTWFSAACAFCMRRFHFFVFSASLILFTAILGADLWYELRQADIDRKTPLVVLAHNTEFYRGNAVSYPQHPLLPVLPRGMEVRQLYRRGQWLQVRLVSGDIGWIHVDNALIVSP